MLFIMAVLVTHRINTILLFIIYYLVLTLTFTRTYSARYRRRCHWGAELALQGARLRFSRAYLAFQCVTPPQTRSVGMPMRRVGMSANIRS